MKGEDGLRGQAIMRELLALTVVATAAAGIVVGCGGDGAAQGDLPVKRIAERVERLRGLEFKRVPEVRLLDQEDFENEIAKIQESAAGAQKADLEQVKRRVVTARQFIFLTGLLEPGDVGQAGRGGADAAGLYSFKTNELLVLNKGSRRSRESTTAHELTHALEDQNFGSRLVTQLNPVSDRAAAYQALLEGSATLVQLRYKQRYLGAHGSIEDDLAQLERKVASAKLPELVSAATSFPYADGGRFALALERRAGDWRLIDRAHRDPPTTTSSVIHPARFLAGERPVAPRMADANGPGEGWAKLGALDIGELDTRLLLRSGLSHSQADSIAAGWAGGTVEAFRRGGPGGCSPPCRRKVALHIAWTWRSESAVAAFSKAMPEWLGRALKATPQGADTWKLDGGAAATATRGRETHLTFAPSARLAAALAGG